jgi:hypothetical protein
MPVAARYADGCFVQKFFMNGSREYLTGSPGYVTASWLPGIAKIGAS